MDLPADRARFAAYTARAERPNGAGIVSLPDVRGLHHFYEELALRFAEAGINAVAIDYFGRTAGSEPRDDSFEIRPHMEHEEACADAWRRMLAFIERHCTTRWLSSTSGSGTPPRPAPAPPWSS